MVQAKNDLNIFKIFKNLATPHLGAWICVDLRGPQTHASPVPRNAGLATRDNTIQKLCHRNGQCRPIVEKRGVEGGISVGGICHI